MEQSTAGEAMDVAYTELSAVIANMLTLSTVWKLRPEYSASLEGLQELLTTHAQNVVEASNRQVDDFNAALDELEATKAELDAAQITLAGVTTTSQARIESLNAEITALKALRNDDVTKVKGILAASDQISRQRDSALKEVAELRKRVGEAQRLTAQVKRLKESAEKRETEQKVLTQNLQHLKTKLVTAQAMSKQAHTLLEYVRASMIFEGLAPEMSVECGNETYHIYRRPGEIWRSVKALGDDPISTQHQYYFRIETNGGYHVDAMPLSSGAAGYAKHRAIPKEIKKIVCEEFQKETTFDNAKMKLRTDGLSEKLSELSEMIDLLGNLNVCLDFEVRANRAKKK